MLDAQTGLQGPVPEQAAGQAEALIHPRSAAQETRGLGGEFHRVGKGIAEAGPDFADPVGQRFTAQGRLAIALAGTGPQLPVRLVAGDGMPDPARGHEGRGLVEADLVALIGAAGIIAQTGVQFARHAGFGEPIVPRGGDGILGEEIFELAVQLPAILEFTVQFDGKGEVGQFRIAALDIDAEADMTGPAVGLQGADRGGQPAARPFRSLGQVDRRLDGAVFGLRGFGNRGFGGSRIRQRPVGHGVGTVGEMIENGLVHRRPPAGDEDRDHVGDLDETFIRRIPTVGLGQQLAVAFRQFGMRQGRQEQHGQGGDQDSRHDYPLRHRPVERVSGLNYAGGFKILWPRVETRLQIGRLEGDLDRPDALIAAGRLHGLDDMTRFGRLFQLGVGGQALRLLLLLAAISQHGGFQRLFGHDDLLSLSNQI
jgi:hypothetical protein